MSSESASYDLVMNAVDNSSDVINKNATAVAAFNAALKQLAQEEQANAVLEEARIKFETLSDAEKDALASSEDLKTSHEDLGQSTESAGLSMTDLNSGIALVRQGVEVLNKAYDATIGKSQAYAEQVRNLKAVSGQSAESTSRFIQVLDDYQISAEDAMAATKALTKQGLAPTTETLAKLSGEYNSLSTVEEKNAFVTKNLGKAGLEWTNVLKQGPEAIRANSAAVADGLILSDKQLAAAERLRLSQDQLNDAWQALSITVGTQATPVLSTWVTMLNGASDWQAKWSEQIQRTNGWALIPGIALLLSYSDAANQNATATDALATSQDGLKQSTEDAAKAAADQLAAQKAIYDANTAMVSSISTLESQEEAYNSKIVGLMGDRAKAEQDLAALRREGYSEQSTQIQGAIGKLDEIKAKEAELEKERGRQSLEFISNLLLQKLSLDGLTTAEFDAFAKQQVAWGLWSADIQKQASDAYRKVDEINNAIHGVQPTTKVVFDVVNHREAVVALENEIAKVQDKTVTITVNTSAPASTLDQARAVGGSATGKTLVGERGPELVDLPSGSYVHSAGTTKNILNQTNNNQSAPTLDLSAISDQLAASAAMMQALPDMIARALRGNEKYSR